MHCTQHYVMKSHMTLLFPNQFVLKMITQNNTKHFNCLFNASIKMGHILYSRMLLWAPSIFAGAPSSLHEMTRLPFDKLIFKGTMIHSYESLPFSFALCFVFYLFVFLYFLFLLRFYWFLRHAPLLLHLLRCYTVLVPPSRALLASSSSK